MTMENIKETIKREFPDEIEGCNLYLDCAQICAENDEPESAKGFYEAAKDEYTHARFLREQAHNYGVKLEPKDLMEYHELEERLQAVFR